MIGFFYPAWASFKAIETKQKGDDTQWLIYWTVYAFFSILEAFIDFLLYFVPFYYAFKLGEKDRRQRARGAQRPAKRQYSSLSA